MVGVLEREAGARARGKLRRDPAIHNAAVALLYGLDPVEFLSRSPGDYLVTALALEKAEDIAAERRKQLADYQSASTAGMTARAITKWIARNFRR